MKITYDETYQASLTDIGAELVRMIKDRDYHLIAERFAYALAYDRPIAEAIASDIDFCLVGEGRSSVIGLAHEPRIQVSYWRRSLLRLRIKRITLVSKMLPMWPSKKIDTTCRNLNPCFINLCAAYIHCCATLSA
jgi:hypothetical protein